MSDLQSLDSVLNGEDASENHAQDNLSIDQVSDAEGQQEDTTANQQTSNSESSEPGSSQESNDDANKAVGQNKSDSVAESKNESSDTSIDGITAAMLQERRKRQELEEELRGLRSQQETVKIDKESKEEKEELDFIADPDRAMALLEKRIDEKSKNAYIVMSQQLMRKLHKDYDEVESVFVEKAKDNPALIGEMRNSLNPAEFAYETGLKFKELDKIKNLDAYKSEIREQVRKELTQELKAQSEVQAKKQSIAEQPSLLDARSANNQPVQPVTLDQILSYPG